MKNINQKSSLLLCLGLMMMLSAAAAAQSGRQLFVRLPNAPTLTLDVQFSDTTENVKTKIYDLRGIPTPSQRLFFEGNQMQDSFTLGDYNIPDEATIYLVVASDTLTVTHQRDVKLPARILNTPHLTINDSGLGATDLDQTNGLIWMQRYIVSDKRFYRLNENGDGTASFGGVITSEIQSTLTAIAERHLNPAASEDRNRSLFGIIGLNNRYNLMDHAGQVEIRWLTGLTLMRAIVYGGGNTSIVFTGRMNFNGVPTRLASIDRDTQISTRFSGDLLGQTGKNLGEAATMAYGADEMLYLLDTDNRRILKFDLGLRGGVRGALLGTFDLDPTRPVVNSMTMDPSGNFYVGNGKDGFNIYDPAGQWRQNVEGIYPIDPNADIPALARYLPNLNYYASGLNDGNGTVDVRDASGYRQYTITAPGQIAPLRITSEPPSWTAFLSSPTVISVAASGNGVPLTYQWRKDGVNLTDGGTISGAATANLTIASTAFTDAGYYDVIVRRTNAIVTSQAAIITVLAPTAADVSLSGRILAGKRGVSGATVVLTDRQGADRQTRTNPFGYFRFAEVAAGETYIVRIRAKRYRFAPQVVAVTEDLSELNFSADDF